MISVVWRDGSVSYVDGEFVFTGDEARPRRVLSKPATDTESVIENEGHVEVEVRLKPGDGPRYVRAALRTLPGAVVMIDDGDG